MNKHLYSLVLIACLCCSACLQNKEQTTLDFLQAKGWVNDFEKILTEKEEKELEFIIEQFEQQTQIEIAIVTLDSTLTTKSGFDDYTLDLANSWGVGKKESNKGVLIGFSSSLRIIRIHNGTGIEEVISDAETKEVIDKHFIPYFKKDEYFKGLFEGTKELMKRLE
ncbi:MAG: TPM domain-containing protein [Bacteroidota bacterium]